MFEQLRWQLAQAQGGEPVEAKPYVRPAERYLDIATIGQLYNLRKSPAGVDFP
jgi:hypothetical protein